MAIQRIQPQPDSPPHQKGEQNHICADCGRQFVAHPKTRRVYSNGVKTLTENEILSCKMFELSCLRKFLPNSIKNSHIWADLVEFIFINLFIPAVTNIARLKWPGYKFPKLSWLCCGQ